MSRDEQAQLCFLLHFKSQICNFPILFWVKACIFQSSGSAVFCDYSKTENIRMKWCRKTPKIWLCYQRTVSHFRNYE